MPKVALIIIYNHQFNKNIEILENIYRSRFSNIYHLMPFYNGEKENVIPVYESSHYFQGYVAQGYKQYFSQDYTHYLFVADDLILNPAINEQNYTQHLHLNSTSCFIPNFITFHERKGWWTRVGEAFRWTNEYSGVEAKNQLPSYEEALEKFQQFGLSIEPLKFNQIWKTPRSLHDLGKMALRDRYYFLRLIGHKAVMKSYSLSYPLVGSYSDIFLVSADAIKEFCHYCGVFAATRLFVEVALPTALVLAAKDIVTEKDMQLQGKPLWTEEEYKELDKFEGSLKKLLEEFPRDYLYLHPIKLSKWDTKI